MPGYISEYDHYGNGIEFIELAIPAGTDVSGYQVVIYGPDGYADHVISLSDLTVETTIHGTDVYLIQPGTPGFAGIDSGDSTALIDDNGTVLQFVTHSSATTAQDGPAAGETSTYIGQAMTDGSSLQSDDGGATYYVQSAENPGVIPCFAEGTLIDTPEGAVRVEALAEGQLVHILEGPPKPVLWVRRERQRFDGMPREARPVLIAAGALGPGRPMRDLIVSPQHRVLAGGAGQLERWFGDEVLVPAKALTGLSGIRFMMGRGEINWVHFAFAGHEIVRAEGGLAESLLLGPMVLAGLHRLERHRLRRTIGAGAMAARVINGPPARPCLSVGQVHAVLGKRFGRPAAADRCRVKPVQTACAIQPRIAAATASGFWWQTQ